jgi:transcription elongation factor Elf1
MLVDTRCPFCDRVMMGKEAVVIAKRKPKGVKNCPHCGGKVLLVENEDPKDAADPDFWYDAMFDSRYQK